MKTQKGFFTLSALIIIAIISGVIGYHSLKQIKTEISEVRLGKQLAVAGETYFLGGSGINSSQTTVDLTKFGYTKPNGTYQTFTMTNFGDLGCGTLQPGNSSGKQEFVSFTGITQNSNGTAQLTGASRGLERFDPYAASTTLRTSHAGGTKFVVANSPPCFYENYMTLKNDEAVVGLKTFNTILPTSSITATATDQFTIKGYVDDVANQGAATSTETNGGIVELATRTEVASSTASTSDKPLVVQAQHASSTPMTFTGSGNTYVIVSEDDGKMSQSWLDLTENYTWTGDQIFTNSTTTNATTTTLNVSGQTTLNTVVYSFPASQEASSTVLTGDGSGNLVWTDTDWSQLGETISAEQVATTTVSGLATRKDLKIVIDMASSTAQEVIYLQFNGNDVGYGWEAERYGVIINGTGNGIGLGHGTTTQRFFTIFITNTATDAKLVRWTGVHKTSGNNPPAFITGAGIWDNTAQINQVDIYFNDNKMGEHTRLTVYGKRD